MNKLINQSKHLIYFLTVFPVPALQFTQLREAVYSQGGICQLWLVIFLCIPFEQKYINIGKPLSLYV